jgi:hypothetical protein
MQDKICREKCEEVRKRRGRKKGITCLDPTCDVTAILNRVPMGGGMKFEATRKEEGGM